MKINYFRGEVTEDSAEKEALVFCTSVFVSADTSVESPHKSFIFIIKIEIIRIKVSRKWVI